jgi:hypothetical protein
MPCSLVPVHQITQHHIPEDHSLDLKSIFKIKYSTPSQRKKKIQAHAIKSYNVVSFTVIDLRLQQWILR